MTWWRSRLRARLETAEALVESLRRQAWTLSHDVLRERAEKDLIRQARDQAQADVAYWKGRAEKFLDQIAFKQGMISMPTMTEPEGPAGTTVDTVFSALGVEAIHRDSEPAPVAAAAAMAVTGVDAAAAQAALDGLLHAG